MTPGNETSTRLAAARDSREQAVRDYRDAILAAREDGWTYTEIGRVIGMSEAGVRLWIKRHR